MSSSLELQTLAPPSDTVSLEDFVGGRPELEVLVEHVEGLAASGSLADNSVRIYASSFNQFRLWATSMGLPVLPTTPAVVLFHLGHLRSVAAGPSVVGVRGAAIRHMHLSAGYDDPTKHPQVRQAFRGYGAWWARSEHARPVQRAHPLSVPELRTMLNMLPNHHTQFFHARSPKAVGLCRAALRAELLVSWHLGRRLDEMVRARTTDLVDLDEVRTMFTSTSQKCRPDGFSNTLHRTTDPLLCPVSALHEWLTVSAPYRFGVDRLFPDLYEQPDGSLWFVDMIDHHHTRIASALRPSRYEGLSTAERQAVIRSEAVGVVTGSHRGRLTNWMRAAGIEPVRADRRLGGHSTRRGLITELQRVGVDLVDIKQHVGIRSLNVLVGYSDHSNGIHPMKQLGL